MKISPKALAFTLNERIIELVDRPLPRLGIQGLEKKMNEFENEITSALVFCESLPATGTALRPAAGRQHAIAAREGVMRAAVISSIVGARATSTTAAEFSAATHGSIGPEICDDLYAADATAEEAENFAARIIAAYGSAANFVAHAKKCFGQ